jgi:hypothetical protein
MPPRYPMFIVNESVPLVLKLNPNPNSISIERSKVYSKNQTIGGWVFEHWGEQPRMLHVRGRTQPVLDNSKEGQNNDIGVESAIYGLQQVYNLDKRQTVDFIGLLKNPGTIARIRSGNVSVRELRELSRTFIYYKFDLYNGFFTNFSYSQDGETSPRHYEYEFEFMVTSSAQSVLTDTIFMSALSAGTGFASLAKIGAEGNLAQGAALLAGSRVIRAIGGLR